MTAASAWSYVPTASSASASQKNAALPATAEAKSGPFDPRRGRLIAPHVGTSQMHQSLKCRFPHRLIPWSAINHLPWITVSPALAPHGLPVAEGKGDACHRPALAPTNSPPLLSPQQCIRDDDRAQLTQCRSRRPWLRHEIEQQRQHRQHQPHARQYAADRRSA